MNFGDRTRRKSVDLSSGTESVKNYALKMMMSENQQQSLRRKTRSASICAPGSSSMEQMLSSMPPPGKENMRDGINCGGGVARVKKDSGNATPESSSTPTRRRRPATRSQSARVSGANKSIRKRAAQQGEECDVVAVFLWNRAWYGWASG